MDTISFLEFAPSYCDVPAVWCSDGDECPIQKYVFCIFVVKGKELLFTVHCAFNHWWIEILMIT